MNYDSQSPLKTRKGRGRQKYERALFFSCHNSNVIDLLKLESMPMSNCLCNWQVGKEVRATLLGVASRGVGCGMFNSPAIYGSVSKSFDWIKNTIAKEMPKEDEACPADLKDKVDISAPKGSKLKNLNKLNRLNNIVFPEHRHDYENEETNHYLKKHGTKTYLIETVG